MRPAGRTAFPLLRLGAVVRIAQANHGRYQPLAEGGGQGCAHAAFDPPKISPMGPTSTKPRQSSPNPNTGPRAFAGMVATSGRVAPFRGDSSIIPVSVMEVYAVNRLSPSRLPASLARVHGDGTVVDALERLAQFVVLLTPRPLTGEQ